MMKIIILVILLVVTCCGKCNVDKLSFMHLDRANNSNQIAVFERAINTETIELNYNESLECDTMKLRNGIVKLANVKYTSNKKVWFTSCIGNDTIIYCEKKTVIDTIIYEVPSGLFSSIIKFDSANTVDINSVSNLIFLDKEWYEIDTTKMSFGEVDSLLHNRKRLMILSATSVTVGTVIGVSCGIGAALYVVVKDKIGLPGLGLMVLGGTGLIVGIVRGKRFFAEGTDSKISVKKALIKKY